MPDIRRRNVLAAVSAVAGLATLSRARWAQAQSGSEEAAFDHAMAVQSDRMHVLRTAVLQTQPTVQLKPSSLLPEDGLGRSGGLLPERSRREVFLDGTGAGGNLRLFNVHTGESVALRYRDATGYDHLALRDLSVFLRDWRQNAVHDVDPGVVDILSSLQKTAAQEAPLYVLSGYRTHATNQYLASVGYNVAPASFHTIGKAIDIAQPGYDLSGLHEAALRLGAGGVGHYPGDGFIHVDSGPVRQWTA